MAYKKFSLFATCYDKRNRIISAGENNYKKSHPLMKQLALQLGEHPEKIYLHAEVQALLRAGDTEVYRLLVQRFNAEGRPALAKPCRICQKALQMYGVKVVEYSTDSGEVDRL